MLQGTLGWVWIVWSNVASKIWRKKEKSVIYLTSIYEQINQCAFHVIDRQTNLFWALGSWGRAKQTNKKQPRLSEERVRTKALSLPFLALVLPHCFSRSSYFFCASSNYRESGTGYRQTVRQTDRDNFNCSSDWLACVADSLNLWYKNTCPAATQANLTERQTDRHKLRRRYTIDTVYIKF